MKKSLIISSVLAVAILGAGCQLPIGKTGTATPAPKPIETPKLASANGFGKLPTLDIAPPADSATRSSAPTPGATAAPLSAPTLTGETANAIAVRPMPIPSPPETPGTVSYDVTDTIPTWGAEENVLRTLAANLASSQMPLLAQATGLPTQALSANAKASSLSFSWIEPDGFSWSYDAIQRAVSFWKQDSRVYANAEQNNTPPTINDADFIKIAENFIASKGFDSTTHAPGVVEKPWGDATDATGLRMPCAVPMMGDAVKTSIAPDAYPCSYPQQVNVTFGAIRDGRRISDAGGWPFAGMSVTIDLNSKSVVGGSVWLNQDVDASRYQLIDRETAIKRLKSGGRNPVWSWGSGVNVPVKITTVDLVWMRYDSWDPQNGNATYFIPALAGTGTVEYEVGQTQVYRTIVPLVADEAFEPINPPQPMPLDVQASGGGAGSEPAGTGTVTPSTR